MKIEIEFGGAPTSFGEAFESFTVNSTIDYGCDFSWINPVDRRTGHFHQVIRLWTRGDHPRKFAHFIAQGTPNGSLVEVTMLDEDTACFEKIWLDFRCVLMQRGLAYDSMSGAAKQVEITTRLDIDSMLTRVSIGEVQMDEQRAKIAGEGEPPLARAFHESWKQDMEQMQAEMKQAEESRLLSMKRDWSALDISRVNNENLLASQLASIKGAGTEISHLAQSAMDYSVRGRVK